MTIQSPKLPLSSVYLNLLQARPVGPSAPVTRPAAPAAPPRAAVEAAPERPAAASAFPARGRFFDIIA
ncbi:MAG: hypothetical protein JO010_05830 [Alphaproteobacteria bacterium]|nr:hypothetical protein [Alphaproteobacteria bacterium]